MQRLVGRQLRVEPLRQEGGVTVRVVVQAVPDGGLWGEDVSLHGKLHGTEPYLGLLSKGHTFVEGKCVKKGQNCIFRIFLS